MFPVYWVKIFKLINNSLNSVSFYYKLINKLKMQGAKTIIDKIVLLLDVIWYLKMLSA